LNGEILQSYNHPKGGILDYSPDGKFLATGGGGFEIPDSEKIKLWNLEENKFFMNLIDTIKSSGADIKSPKSIAFSKDGRFLVIGYHTGSTVPRNSNLVIWDRQNYTTISYLYYPKMYITKMRFTPDSKFLAVGFSYQKSNYVLFIDTKTWEVKMPSLQHPEAVQDFTFTSDGTKLITGCDDNNIRIWNTETIILERMIKVEGDIRALGISKDDKYLFYQWMGGLNGGLLKKDLNAEKVLYNYNINIFPISKTTMTSIDISPNDQSFIAGSSLGVCLYKADLLSSINETNKGIETIYPNPTNGMIKINFYNPSYQFLRVELQNISGALIDTIFSGNLEQGEQSINYNGNNLFAGNYIITLSAKGFSKSFKLIKEK